MIEQTLLNYLNENLNVPVYMEQPKVKTYPFILVEKTGSNQNSKMFESTFAIQSYGTSLFDAAEINESVKSLLINNGAFEMPNVTSCKLNSDYNFTDSTTKDYRYQAVFDIMHY